MGEVLRADGLDFQVPEPDGEIEDMLTIAFKECDRLVEGRIRHGLGPEGTLLSGLRSGSRPFSEGDEQNSKPL